MKKVYGVTFISLLFFSFFLLPTNPDGLTAYRWIQNTIALKFESYSLAQWIDDDRPTLIYTMPPRDWLGDSEVIRRIILTARQMGWNILSAEASKTIPSKKLKNAFGLYTYDVFQEYAHFPEKIPLVKIIWVINKDDSETPEKYINFLKKHPPHQRVSGILGSSYYSIDTNIAQKNRIGNLKFIMTWYPTVKATDYQPQLKGLMYAGTKHPGDMRSELKKYVKMREQLDKTGYFYAYGHEHAWKGFQSYKGYIPADGDSFVKQIHKHGICLVLHNHPHLVSGSPSGRIFEAAAAAAVIISDKHLFVEKEFKDSVLYVDQTRDDLFEQIDAHMRWIKSNPEKAKAKARRAHAIFTKKFTLEQQLSRLYQNIQTMKAQPLQQ